MHLICPSTNRFLHSLLILMTSISATAQSPSKNYVQTKMFLDAAGATFLRHIDYYDEQVTYNPNGSITSLLCNGMRNDVTFGAIDDLSIDYDGNRLLKVTDDAEALNYNGALDFNDGDDGDCEYRYDSNGALTYDSNRGISSIQKSQGQVFD